MARTYIDSLALGIDRIFWYGWNDHILGIDQVDPQSGAILPAGQAYLTVQDWLVGGYWQGCSGELMDPTGEAGAVTSCDLATRDRQPAMILFSHGAAATHPDAGGRHGGLPAGRDLRAGHRGHPPHRDGTDPGATGRVTGGMHIGLTLGPIRRRAMARLTHG